MVAGDAPGQVPRPRGRRLPARRRAPDRRRPRHHRPGRRARPPPPPPTPPSPPPAAPARRTRVPRVEVKGGRVGGLEPRVVYALHKRVGGVSTVRDPQGRPTVLELLR